MRILHIEQGSETANSFIQQLHAGTGCRIEHVDTLHDGLLNLKQGHGSVDIVLYTLTPTSTDALVFPERVRAIAAVNLIRCPDLVLLATAPLPLPSAAKCMDRQVVYLLRDCPKQIIETVRVLLWRVRSSKPGPTIRIVFRTGHHRFFIRGRSTSEELILSMQLSKLLLLLLGGVRTVDALADMLGVGRMTIKKYMRELRLALEARLKEMNIPMPAADVVWMRRGAGGTLCGLLANAVWD